MEHNAELFSASMMLGKLQKLNNRTGSREDHEVNTQEVHSGRAAEAIQLRAWGAQERCRGSDEEAHDE
jgi:hypothetical protein